MHSCPILTRLRGHAMHSCHSLTRLRMYLHARGWNAHRPLENEKTLSGYAQGLF